MSEDAKLPGSSFEEVSKVIQGYALANRKATLDDISRRTGMHPSIISRNNGFLVYIGVLEGGRDKIITPLGKRLGDALSHGLEVETRNILREVVESSEFLKNVAAAVRIRRGMEESALRAHIAYSAGLSKSAQVMTGAGAVVELLRRAALVEEQDGKLVAGPATATNVSGVQSSLPSIIETADTVHEVTVQKSMGNLTRRTQTATVHVELRVNCTPSELDGLGSKIRSLLSEINAGSANVTNPDDDSSE